MKFFLRIDGKEEVIARVKKLTAEQVAAIDQALWQTAGQIAMQAKNNARTLFDHPTGRLMGSITLASTWGKATVPSAPAKPEDAVSIAEDHLSHAVVVGTNVKYARRVEHGFYGPDKLGRVYAQPGKPFLYPAYFSLIYGLRDRLKKAFARKAGST